MTIRHLKIFVTVVDCGKMNLAAKKLYVAQPTISQAIKELEDEYGVKLFERLNQRLYITDTGKRLLPYARHILDSYEAMDHTLKNEGELPILRIGASITVGTCMLGGILERVNETKAIQAVVTVNNTTYIEQKILDSSLDVGIVEGSVVDENIIQIPVCHDELVIVVGKKHPFYQKKIKITELEGQQMVAREDGSQQRNQYEILLNQQGIETVKSWHCSNTEAIKRTITQGNGFSILSAKLVKEEVADGRLYIVPVQDIKVNREMHLIYHKNKFISRSMKSFIEITQEHLSSDK